MVAPSRRRSRSPSTNPTAAAAASSSLPVTEVKPPAQVQLPARWTVIDGAAYELPDSLFDSHPGGGDLLALAHGRDASILFGSYHGRPKVARAWLSSLPRLGGGAATAALASAASADPNSRPVAARALTLPHSSALWAELRARADTEMEADRAALRAWCGSACAQLLGGGVGFSSAGGSRGRGGLFMLVKSLVTLAVTASLYAVALGLVPLPPAAAEWLPPLPVLAAAFGIALAFCGLSVQHDANHGALTRWPWVNVALACVDDLIGGSALLWRHQHVVAHHAQPNDADLDADSYGAWPALRLNPALRREWWHAYQWLYAPALYTLVGVGYAVGEVAAFAARAYVHVPLLLTRRRDAALFLLGKTAHWVIALGLPVYLLGWRAALLAWWLPMQAAGGLLLACTFAVSHNVPCAQYNALLPRAGVGERAGAGPAPETDATRVLKNARALRADAAAARVPPPSPVDWAEMQIRSSANWSTHSTFWWLFSGGLNFQIEHHLFPGVAHEHYPALSRAVRAVCAERGLPYNAYPSFRAIFYAHLRHLYALGNGLGEDGRMHGVWEPPPAPQEGEPATAADKEE